MLIKTYRGWMKLEPPCLNEVWELANWDPIEKRYVKDSNGTLKYMGYTFGLPAGNQPPQYRGVLPSLECQYFIKTCERAHNEWLERRSALVGED